MNNYISSITVTYNPDLVLLARQLNSFKNQIQKIIVVDNASDDIISLEKMITDLEFNDRIYLIKCKDNMGLGFAQNKGIEAAKQFDTTHVLIMDQDSIVADNFIEKMLDTESELQRENIKVGAIGPVYYNEITGEIYPITKYKGPFIERIKPTTEPVEATFLIASGCFININVINDVGGMNENLFIDYVDVEWCFRAKSKGYKLFASPEVRMMHTIGDNRTSVMGRSISVHSPLRRYYLYRNSIYMIKNKSIDSGYKIREITFNVLRLVVFLILSKEKSKYFKYSMSGFLDGFRGKVGKCPYNY